MTLAVNKCENAAVADQQAADFWALGLEPIAVSAISGTGTGDLLDHLTANLPAPREDALEVELDRSQVAVAIVGRPNVGKSSLVNAITGDKAACPWLLSRRRRLRMMVMVHGDPPNVICYPCSCAAYEQRRRGTLRRGSFACRGGEVHSEQHERHDPGRHRHRRHWAGRAHVQAHRHGWHPPPHSSCRHASSEPSVLPAPPRLDCLRQDAAMIQLRRVSTITGIGQGKAQDPVTDSSQTVVQARRMAPSPCRWSVPFERSGGPMWLRW